MFAAAGRRAGERHEQQYRRPFYFTFDTRTRLARCAGRTAACRGRVTVVVCVPGVVGVAETAPILGVVIGVAGVVDGAPEPEQLDLAIAQLGFVYAPLELVGYGPTAPGAPVPLAFGSCVPGGLVEPGVVVPGVGLTLPGIGVVLL
jgi:hypothetical protein